MKVLSVDKKKATTLKVVNNIPNIGLSRSLTYHNSYADITTLILITGWINSYALLSENVPFLENFWRSHICFIRYFNNPTQITWNQFCGVFLKSDKYLGDIFLRRLWDNFLRFVWDLLKMSHKKHLFWDVFEMSLRRHKKRRLFWDVFETS